MTVSEIMQKMIAFSNGNRHDINHLLKVWGYAKTIGDAERLDADTLFILETAAITHDIACPLCREKYGNTNGKYQEAEGEVLVRDLTSGRSTVWRILSDIIIRLPAFPARTIRSSLKRTILSMPTKAAIRQRIFGISAISFSRRKPGSGCLTIYTESVDLRKA